MHLFTLQNYIIHFKFNIDSKLTLRMELNYFKFILFENKPNTK